MERVMEDNVDKIGGGKKMGLETKIQEELIEGVEKERCDICMTWLLGRIKKRMRKLKLEAQLELEDTVRKARKMEFSFHNLSSCSPRCSSSRKEYDACPFIASIYLPTTRPIGLVSLCK